jgi:CHAD domain-containing protein
MAASHHDEIERKFDVETRTVLPNLTSAEGVASVDQPSEFQLEAVYFDTPDYDLARQRITLRRRTGGTDAGWHLKRPAGPDTRTEIREPLGPAGDDVPDPLRTRVRAIVRDRPLAPIAVVNTTRREYVLRDAGGAVLARVCDDSVLGQLLGDDEPDQTWREWEVELDAGPASVLDAVTAVLLAAGAAPASAGSKLGRVVGEIPVVEQVRPSKKQLARGAAGQLLSAHLTEQVARLHEHDAGVRAGHPESVHRLRIAARRLRSALSTFRPILDRTLTDPVQEQLRWLGQSLAQARDAQVLREHLLAMTSSEPEELVIGSAVTRIDDGLRADHQTGLVGAREALESDRYRHLLDALDTLVASPPLRPDADTSARTMMPRLLARDLKRLRRAVRGIEAAPDAAHRDMAFHEARKKAKRLRYAAEVAVPPLGKRARSLAKSAKQAQKVLGAHQDSVNARGRLRELGVQAHLAGDNSFTFGRLHALEQVRAERAEVEFATVWTRFNRKQIPRWTG